MSKHTPGPWTAGWSGDPDSQPLDDAGPIDIVSFGRGGVASCKPIPTGHANTWEIVEANARLIAAAPELLAALRLAHEAITCYEVIPRHEWEAVMNEAEEKAEAALKKAEGNR